MQLVTVKVLFNVAKCNLGKVNLETMLVSSFPCYTRGGPMPLAGAPRDLGRFPFVRTDRPAHSHLNENFTFHQN